MQKRRNVEKETKNQLKRNKIHKDCNFGFVFLCV